MNIKETMIKTGYKDNEAEVIDYIYHHDNATSREIEHTLNLRQPIASIILSKYTDKKWVQETQTKNGGKGRPTKYYHLQKDKVMAELQRRIHYELSEMTKRQRELQTMMLE